MKEITESTSKKYYSLEINPDHNMKPFLNFEQIKEELSKPSEKNKARVHIQKPDENDVRQFLKHHNYYAFSIYKKCLPFRENPNFDFYDCLHIFQFDSFLRKNLQIFTGHIESLVKASIISSLCTNYKGSFQTGECYLDDELYINKERYLENVKLFGTRTYQNKKSLPIKHHIDNKEGHIPLWVILPEFTFGETTYFIDSLKMSIRNQWLTDLFLSNEFYSQETQLHEHILTTATSWISASWALRNLTAHYGRLYGRNFNTSTPRFYTPTIRKLKPVGKKKEHNRDLFAYMLAIKQVLLCYDDNVKTEWNKFIEEIDDKVSNSDILKLSKIGFPESYRQFLIIGQHL